MVMKISNLLGAKAHMADRNNPHGVTAAQLNLEKVQNLPVATTIQQYKDSAGGLYPTVWGVGEFVDGEIKPLRDAINNIPSLPSFASNAVALAGTSTNTLLNPANLNHVLNNRIPSVPSFASESQIDAGTSTNTIVSPAGLTKFGEQFNNRKEWWDKAATLGRSYFSLAQPTDHRIFYFKANNDRIRPHTGLVSDAVFKAMSSGNDYHNLFHAGRTKWGMDPILRRNTYTTDYDSVRPDLAVTLVKGISGIELHSHIRYLNSSGSLNSTSLSDPFGKCTPSVDFGRHYADCFDGGYSEAAQFMSGLWSQDELYYKVWTFSRMNAHADRLEWKKQNRQHNWNGENNQTSKGTLSASLWNNGIIAQSYPRHEVNKNPFLMYGFVEFEVGIKNPANEIVPVLTYHVSFPIIGNS